MGRPKLTRAADGPKRREPHLLRPGESTYGEEKLPHCERLELALVRLVDAVAYENRQSDPETLSLRLVIALQEAAAALADAPPDYGGVLKPGGRERAKLAVDRWVRTRRERVA